MIDRIIGHNIEQEAPLQAQKVKFLVIFSLIMGAIMFMMVFLMIGVGEYSNAFLLVLNGFSFGLPIFLVRIKDYDKSKSVFVGIYWITQIMQMVMGGGFEPRQLIWFCFATIIAFFLLGRSRGFFTMGISVLVLFAFYGLHSMGISFARVDSYDENKELGFLIGLLFFLGFTALLFVFEQKHIESIRKQVEKSSQRLDSAQKLGNSGSFWMDLETGEIEMSNGLLFMFDPQLLLEDELDPGLQSIEEYLRESDLEILNSELENAKVNRKFNEVDLRLDRDNESTDYFKVSGTFEEDKGLFIGLVKDVTNAKKTSKNFQDYKNALDQSALVSITNRSGKIIYTNKKFQEVSKYSEAELIGKDHSVINSGEHDSTFFRGLWTSIAHGKIWRGTIRNQAKDNSYFWVDTTIIPFLDEHKRPDYYMAIRFDVTEQAITSEEILRKNKELEQFSYVLSHDLKSPLRAIKTLIHFIKEDMEDANLELPGEVEKNFDLIDGRVVRMEALIMSVLSYAQVGSSKEKEWVKMNEIVSEVLELIDIPPHFKMNISQDLPEIFMNRVEIKQVVQNLLTNAVKYNDKENPEIIIYPGLKKKNFMIHFKDNGKGIDPRFHDKIFNLFETLKQKESFDATGIGLPIVKKVVEQAGGDISVRSTPGEGADFILKFPLSVCKM